MNNNDVPPRFAPRPFSEHEGRASVLMTNQTTTMTDYPYYNWNYVPDDGEFELQFDRFESSADGDRYDLTILLIIDTEKNRGEEERFVGDVAYPTADIPSADPDEPNMTRIYHATIVNNKIVEMTHYPELSQQRHGKAQKQYDRLTGKTDNESDG